jgi:hypothetical protein
MSNGEDWYTILHSAGMQPLKHLYREEELASALRLYGYVRRDVPPDYRIDLRWAEQGLPPHGERFDGQIWSGQVMVAQRGASRVALLLYHLRQASVELEPGLIW